jgi:uncharacterized protein (TIGR03435 family)
MCRAAATAAVIANLAAVALDSRAQTTATPRFEVASVKRSTSGAPGFTMMPEPGRFSASNVPLRFIIMAAFRVPMYRLDGGPGWIDSERYDIQGKEPDGAPPQQWPERLRTLLAERFSLATHTERRSVPGFALMLARGDGRLGERLRRTDGCENTPSLPPCGQARGSDHSYQMNGLGLSMLANVLTLHVGRPVDDRTGLTGTFVVELDWALERRPGPPSAPPDNGVALVTAIQEQLGLKLQRERVDVDVVVIDRVERPAPD